MEISILDTGAFAHAELTLSGQERFVSESGALFHMSANVDVDVTTRSRGRGGVLAGLGRLLGGDSFFLSSYTLTDGSEGRVGLAPVLPGDVARLEVSAARGWITTGGSFLGAGGQVELETRFQGLRGVLSGEGLFLLAATGEGPLLVSGFGHLFEREVDGELLVDSGHLVALEDTLDYSITRAGSSWVQSFLGGEGFVVRLTGRGKVWIQSRHSVEFGRMLGRLLPPREA